MSNEQQPQNKNLTAAEVEQQRREAEQREGGESITVDNKQVQLQNNQGGNQNQNVEGGTGTSPEGAGAKATGDTGQGKVEGGINKISLQTQYLKIEITDPNILDDLNTEDRYPTEIAFDRLELNMNKHGGRLSMTTLDKKGLSREVLSGVNKKETTDLNSWTLN